MKKLLLLIPLLFYSCDYIKIQVPVKEEPKIEVVTYDFNKDKAQSISTVYTDIPAEDCIVIYKLFRGTALYLETVSQPPEYVAEVITNFGKVRDSYGWKPEKYKSLTDAVETYLKDEGYSDPSKKFADNKIGIVSSFNTLAESARIAWLKKNEPK